MSERVTFVAVPLAQGRHYLNPTHISTLLPIRDGQEDQVIIYVGDDVYNFRGTIGELAEGLGADVKP
jgi:hypothetical protein